MIRLETEPSIDILRQTALLLERENLRLHARLIELSRALAESRGTAAEQLTLQIRQLEEELAQRNRKLFGASSEKRPRTEGEAETTAPADPAKPRTGHGPRQQPALPTLEVTHTLDAPDQMCPKCGGDLQPWDGQFEEAEEIDVVERCFRLVKHRRQKYRCACGSCVETALGPDKLIPGGRYSVDVALAVAVGKYADHLPLERQVRQMARDGLVVDSQTLWDQIFALSRHLEPSYRRLADYVLSSPVIGADETTWRLMQKRGVSRYWVWAITRPDAVWYRILGSRSAKAAQTVLGNYRGIVMADGYGAYGCLQREIAERGNGVTFELAHCWAHLRRKLVEAEPHYAQCKDVVTLVGTLYEIEARARSLGMEAGGGGLLELRQEQSAPIVQAIRNWLNAEGLTALPQSAIGKAIRYAFDLWKGLTKFLGNSAIPLDNNQSERGMRGVALGRKNHYGSRSLRGTEVAAIFYSHIESAKLAGVEPAAYLREAVRRAIARPGAVTLPGDLLGAAINTS